MHSSLPQPSCPITPKSIPAPRKACAPAAALAGAACGQVRGRARSDHRRLCRFLDLNAALPFPPLFTRLSSVLLSPLPAPLAPAALPPRAPPLPPAPPAAPEPAAPPPPPGLLSPSPVKRSPPVLAFFLGRFLALVPGQNAWWGVRETQDCVDGF
jgi:hypothetical protein